MRYSLNMALMSFLTLGAIAFAAPVGQENEGQAAVEAESSQEEAGNPPYGNGPAYGPGYGPNYGPGYGPNYGPNYGSDNGHGSGYGPRGQPPAGWSYYQNPSPGYYQPSPSGYYGQPGYGYGRPW